MPNSPVVPRRRAALLLSGLLVAIVAAFACAPRGGDHSEADLDTPWYQLFEEARMAALQARLSAEHRPADVAFVGVDVLNPDDEAPHSNRTVLVHEGVITAMGARDSVAVPAGYLTVNGAGRLLVPGLVDMHVHTLERSAHMLLELANGVTSVREMDGFRWLLRQRDQVRAGNLLAPTLYVAGTILNARPMDYYATMVRTPEEARAAVRAQKAAGFDFIKVHNVLPKAVYQAIGQEAAAVGLRLVGHIPHDITVAEAVAAGQRTHEHFKGYLLDGNLTESPEDYVASIRGAEVWNCPTFYTRRLGYTHAQVESLDATLEFRYVSGRDRTGRLAATSPTGDPGPQKVFALSRHIFSRLRPAGARFLAGTDAGGYRNTVPGFALLEELSLLESAGLSRREVLRAATLNAAEAMERTAEFGRVAVGLSADLLLLDANPRDGLATLHRPAGVMAHGVWLDRAALDALLAGVESVYRAADADPTLDAPGSAQVETLLQEMDGLAARGWVFKDHQLEVLAARLRLMGREGDAGRVLGWRSAS